MLKAVENEAIWEVFRGDSSYKGKRSEPFDSRNLSRACAAFLLYALCSSFHVKPSITGDKRCASIAPLFYVVIVSLCTHVSSRCLICCVFVGISNVLQYNVGRRASREPFVRKGHGGDGLHLDRNRGFHSGKAGLLVPILFDASESADVVTFTILTLFLFFLAPGVGAVYFFCTCLDLFFPLILSMH